MKKLNKNIFIWMILFTIGISYFFPILKSFAKEAVDVNVLPCPAIDIVLAKAKTKVDVNQFETDLKNELIQQNISPDRVKINAVEAVEANIQDSFNWEKDMSSTIGSIDITNHGQNIVMKGNKKNPGKNAIWIIPEKQQEQEITFDYSVDFGDSFNAAGMLLRVKQTGNTLTGYMLSVNKSGKTWYTTAGKKYGAIWKFTYQLGENNKNMTKTFVQGVDIATSGRLTIKSTNNEIIISGGGLTAPISYTMDTEYGYGFGFFSDHYSHNCSKIGAFTLGNISLTTTTVKKFKEVLSNPEWRENSFRFLVNVDDYENEELKNKAEFASLQTRLINEEIHPIFWGTDTNKAQSNEVIESNHNHGTFIDNTDYTKAIQATVKYIKSLLEGSKSSQYALVGEPTELKVTPETAKNNTISPDYPQGKWKINHDYEYFENHLGQFQNSGKYMSDLALSFDKTGRYELLYEDGNIASKYIYVHRKPVASFNLSQINGNVTLNSTSYDLDKYSDNHGIAQEEWSYKKVDESTWNSGKLTNIASDEVYVVQLRVKDFQETWSAPTTKYVMYNTQADSTPVASFNLKHPILSKYEALEIENSSYDPAGVPITEENWKVKKDGNVLYSGKTPLTDYSNYQTGNYTISLIVTNQSGKKSEEFSRTFELVEDTIAPEVIATPTNHDWTNQPVTIHLNFSDKGGSKFKGYQYAITGSADASTSWSEIIAKETDTITIDTEGEKYLHIISYDHAGNVSDEKVLGPYKIDLTPAEISSIVPENTDWTNQSIHINVAFSDKGGSGFSGYKYAMTTTQTSPETWSEIIKEDTATFTISDETEHYLHMITYDHAGNESDEIIHGPYQLDTISPKANVTPQFSDWTNQPITVGLNWEDEGGSHLQKYAYAITDCGIKPETFDHEITGDPEPIIITSEGENYLHLIGYDHAGNTSPDYIFGKYKLDLTLPELICDSDIDSNTELFSAKFTATDTISGISDFTVNGTKINGTEYIATSNGDYQFVVTDNAGNTLKKDVTLNNLYHKCDKNLGHPNFTSSTEKCPICDLIAGIKVNSSEKTYTGSPISVSYENTKNANVIEYYDNTLNKPSEVGNYHYELKINYGGIEYNTGIKGILLIHEKPVDEVENIPSDEKTEITSDKTSPKDETVLPENTDKPTNTNENKPSTKRPVKNHILGKLLYTGRHIEITLIIVLGVMVFLNIMSGKILLSSKGSPRILKTAIKNSRNSK